MATVALNELRGRWIVLEGIDGSGTTTQAAELSAWLREQGLNVHETREPSGGPVGRMLRRQLSGNEAPVCWEGMALLFAADRADHVEREVAPALARGDVVVCDRFDLSSLAYQFETGPGDDESFAWLKALNSRFPRPDLTIVLEVSAEVAQGRRASRGGPEELFERLELQRRLCRQYARAAELVPGDRVVMLDGSTSSAAVRDELRQEVCAWSAHLTGTSPKS